MSERRITTLAIVVVVVLVFVGIALWRVANRPSAGEQRQQRIEHEQEQRQRDNDTFLHSDQDFDCTSDQRTWKPTQVIWCQANG